MTMSSLSAASPLASISRFHVVMATLFAAVAILGFVPTFWWKLADGSFAAPPIYHIHGLLVTCWFLFYLTQTLLAAQGRIHAHRMWGMAGIALFSAMSCSVLGVLVTTTNVQTLHGDGDASRQFAAVGFFGLLLLTGLFVTAIARVGRPDIHQRLMLVLMSGMMAPAIGRIFILAMGVGGDGSPPVEVTVVPTLIANLPVLAAMAHDRRSIGHVHPAYKYAGAAVLAEAMLVVPIARTSGWMNFAQWLQHLAG